MAAVDLAGEQAELGGRHAQCSRAKRDREECRDKGELATRSSWSQPPSAGGRVAEMASEATAAARRYRSYLGSSEAEWHGTEVTY